LALEKTIFPILKKRKNFYGSILIFYAIFDVGAKIFSTTYLNKAENKQIKTQF